MHCCAVKSNISLCSHPFKKLKMLLLEIRAVLSSVCNCFGLGCGVKAGSSVLTVLKGDRGHHSC